MRIVIAKKEHFFQIELVLFSLSLDFVFSLFLDTLFPVAMEQFEWDRIDNFDNLFSTVYIFDSYN